jgi:pimeloyl-ACP methyl ester carboxylesterase
LVDDWEELGRKVEHAGEMVYVNDQLAEEDHHHPPLLVIHGFPTSSIDFAETLPALHARRRVIMLDLPGYGFSDKIDRPYSLFGQADAVETVVADSGVTEVDLLSHDMGDSVAGELLARDLDGDLPFSVRRRVVSNGSIYMDLAQLTAGQKLLESIGDRALLEEEAPTEEMLRASLVATMATNSHDSSGSLVDAAAQLIMWGRGNQLLPRVIQYLGERRLHEARWTGAIEAHPSPLSILWGDQDPIAVWAMAERLAERAVNEVSLTRLDGVGHYPMVEAPALFADAVCACLDA